MSRNLLDYLYHQNYNKLIGIDLSRQTNTSIHQVKIKLQHMHNDIFLNQIMLKLIRLIRLFLVE